jgi:hypothetical protein
MRYFDMLDRSRSGFRQAATDYVTRPAAPAEMDVSSTADVRTNLGEHRPLSGHSSETLGVGDLSELKRFM